jgi:FdhE protein
MHRTAAARNRSRGLTLEATAAANPEWAPWLGLLGRAQAATTPSWGITLGLAEPDDKAPLLHRAVVALDTERLAAWTSDLFAAAAPDDAREHTARVDRADSVALLQAAIALDSDRLDAIAERRGEDAHRLGAVMQLVAMPILLGCRTALAGEIPRGWTRGYCPVCGAWPAFTELRGLERERRARCGRCAADWRFDVLRCPFCGERDHNRLAGFVVEGEEERRRIDVCRQCGGYLKGISTLMAVPDEAVPVLDLESVELDLVATERGFARPDGPAVAVQTRVGDRSDVRLRTDSRKWVFGS